MIDRMWTLDDNKLTLHFAGFGIEQYEIKMEECDEREEMNNINANTLYLKTKKHTVPLVSGTSIYQYHIDERSADGQKEIGQVRSKKEDPADVGIKNVSYVEWYVKRPGEEMKSIAPGSTVKIVNGTILTIGTLAAEVVQNQPVPVQTPQSVQTQPQAQTPQYVQPQPPAAPPQYVQPQPQTSPYTQPPPPPQTNQGSVGFDPYTGKPVPPAPQDTQPNGARLQNVPPQRAQAQPSPSVAKMSFDPYTGKPVQAEPPQYSPPDPKAQQQQTPKEPSAILQILGAANSSTKYGRSAKNKLYYGIGELIYGIGATIGGIIYMVYDPDFISVIILLSGIGFGAYGAYTIATRDK
ncbi:hypothetical protein AGMMS49983_01320 [Clostridia bacterium]|nr:hypothetical protein AGMMS49983_01320 [Clostridia bacterium]